MEVELRERESDGGESQKESRIKFLDESEQQHPNARYFREFPRRTEDESEEDENTITLGFRVATGERLFKRFDRRDLVVRVFEFVRSSQQENDQIRSHREFDLLTMGNGRTLRGSMSSSLEEVFGDSKQETLLVK